MNTESLSLNSVLLVVKYPHSFMSETLIEMINYLSSNHKDDHEANITRLVNVLADRDRRALMSETNKLASAMHR